MLKKTLFALAMLLGFAAQALAAGPFTVSVTQIVEHPSLDAMRQGFMDRAKESGTTLEYNVHIAQGNMGTNAQIASQIKGENPDLVLAITTPSAQAVAQKIKDKPIVFTGVTDPVAAGLVASLMKPGANVTGMTDLSPINRQVELIREFIPDLKTLGVLYNAGEPNSVVSVKMLKDYCTSQGIELVEASAVNSAAVYQAAKSLVGRCQAVYVPTDNTIVSALEAALKVCTQSKLPLFSADNDSVTRGSIAALAVDYYRMGLQTADMALRILLDKANPGDMPVESLENLLLYVNPKAAASMGVAVPKSVMDRADEVID